MVEFLLLLAILINFNYVTLESKVNVSLIAELQFNQNDIKVLDKVQRYLGEIKNNILRNFRKRNVHPQYNILNFETNDSIPHSNSVEKMGKYTNFRKNINDNARKNMVDVDIRVKTNYDEDMKKNAKRMERINRESESIETTVGKQQSKTIHIHDVQNKLVIIEMTTQMPEIARKRRSKKNKHRIKPKIQRKNFIKNSIQYKSSMKTTAGIESKTNHIQNKLYIIEMTTQMPKNNPKHKAKKRKPTKHKKLRTKTSSVKVTKPPSARKHGHTVSTLENKELKITRREKSKNTVHKLITKYHQKLEEKSKKIEESVYSPNQTNEKYNNLNEYLKSKMKEENADDKNKEVLEKMKSDLANLFSTNKSNPTPKKADSFEELEKAFGFEM